MPFLSSNKDSYRTHQNSQRLHQSCLSDSSRLTTYRNISLVQTSDQQNLSLDASRSFDEKCDNFVISSPMLQDDFIFNSGDLQDALNITPIEILPLTNVENVTPIKYHSLDLSDLSFSSLNESLEGSENNPRMSNLETPSIGRVTIPGRRREYILSKRPLGALGVSGIITTSTPSTKYQPPKVKESFHPPPSRSNRNVLNSSLQFKKILEDQSERRKTINSWQILSPPRKVQRSESTPDPYKDVLKVRTPSSTFTRITLHGRRENRILSLDSSSILESVGVDVGEDLKESDLKNLLTEDSVLSQERSFDNDSRMESETKKANSYKLIFSPSKNGASPIVKVKRSAPIILSRKSKAKNTSLNSSQNSNPHFTPSKFLNNPQSSTPVSKRLRDRRNSYLDEMINMSSTPKFSPSCKKQIFPDDDPFPSTPSTAKPILSFEDNADDFQVDFSHMAPSVTSGNRDALVTMNTPSRDLNAYHGDQFFSSPLKGLFVDSPIKRNSDISLTNQHPIPMTNDINLPSPAMSSLNLDDFFNLPSDFDFEDDVKLATPKVAQCRRPSAETFFGSGNVIVKKDEPPPPLVHMEISVDNKTLKDMDDNGMMENDGEYFVCDDEDGTSYILCNKDEGGNIFSLGEIESLPQATSETEIVPMNVSDIVENDLPDTFMKVVCCETTHRKSLVQQAREVLGVPEAPPDG